MYAHLDEVLALWLGDQWLQLRCGEGVDEAGLGHDEEEHLSAGEDGQLVRLRFCQRILESRVAMWMSAYLLHDTSLALGEGDVTTRLVLDELDLDLAPLATGLVVVVVIVVGGSAGARALDTSGLAVTIVEVVMVVVQESGILGHNFGHLQGSIGS